MITERTRYTLTCDGKHPDCEEWFEPDDFNLDLDKNKLIAAAKVEGWTFDEGHLCLFCTPDVCAVCKALCNYSEADIGGLLNVHDQIVCRACFDVAPTTCARCEDPLDKGVAFKYQGNSVCKECFITLSEIESIFHGAPGGHER